jgi:hypothetical protein
MCGILFSFIIVKYYINIGLFIIFGISAPKIKKSMTSNLNNKARQNRNDEIDFLRDFDLLTTISP